MILIYFLEFANTNFLHLFGGVNEKIDDKRNKWGELLVHDSNKLMCVEKKLKMR